MMVELDHQAQARWDAYLDEVRQAMSSLPAQELDEIVQELESHLSKDTNPDTGRISDQEIAAVIDRLGSAQSMAEAYGIEPENVDGPGSFDLSLLFASLIVLALGVLFPILEIVLLPASVILARVALQKPAVLSSPYRFIGYPALVVGYLTLLLVCALWPLLPVLPLFATGGIVPELLPDAATSMQTETASYWIGAWLLGVLVTGVWWLILRRLIRNRGELLGRLFYPFTTAGTFPITTATNTLRWGGLLLIAVALLLTLLIRFTQG